MENKNVTLKTATKNFLWKHLPYKTYEKLQIIHGLYIRPWLNIKYRQRRINNGHENVDKTFYIIRVIGRAPLFQYYFHVLSHLVYANQKGYVPIVDMTDHQNTYFSSEKVESDNVWEYYFRQPENITLKQIERSKNIILSTVKRKKQGISLMNSALLGKKEEMDCLSMLINQWMTYNANIGKYCEEQYRELIESRGARNVLGVHVRGTDYIALKPKGHLVQPSIDYIIEMTNRCIEKWNIDLIYICTEDEKLLQGFVAKIETPTVYTCCVRVNQYQPQTSDIMSQLIEGQTERNPYVSGLEYLNDIALLSKCDYLLSGEGLMGTRSAILMNGGKYKDMHIMDLGIYK